MACQVNWTDRAWKTYGATINYLTKEWTERELTNFIKLTDTKIANLSKHPGIGSIRNKKYPNIRFTLVGSVSF